MTKKPMHPYEAPEAAHELAPAVEALTQVAHLLKDAAAQMTVGLQTLQQTLEAMAPKLAAGVPAAVTAQINTWEDDPL